MKRTLSVLISAGLLTTALAQTPIDTELLVSGLNKPTHITHAGDGSGRLFIVLQAGFIRVHDGAQLLATPFLTISNIVHQGSVSGNSEEGLLSVAFHPGYATNGQFFVYFTNANGSSNVVHRFTASPPSTNVVNAATGVTILRIAHPGQSNHNGGQIAFGPDGYLYIGPGDGGGGCDTPNNAQNINTLLGKLLRLDVSNFTTNYTVPPTNPFVGIAGLDEIWSTGLRNPWRFTFDRLTGDLFIGDVGQNTNEEIDFQPAASTGGENYGWKCIEGTRTNSCSFDCVAAGMIPPIAEYTHTFGCSVTGGYVYRGPQIAELSGTYLFSDICSGRIWGATLNGTWHTNVLLDTTFAVSTFGEDESGELYLAHHANATGAIYRVIPGPRVNDVAVTGTNVIIRFSTQTGRNYRLERAAAINTNTWTQVGGNVPGTGGTVQVTDGGAATQTNRFYRVRITP